MLPRRRLLFGWYQYAVSVAQKKCEKSSKVFFIFDSRNIEFRVTDFQLQNNAKVEVVVVNLSVIFHNNATNSGLASSQILWIEFWGSIVQFHFNKNSNFWNNVMENVRNICEQCRCANKKRNPSFILSLICLQESVCYMLYEPNLGKHRHKGHFSITLKTAWKPFHNKRRRCIL